ncbi:hypothetical protein ACJ73_08073 [Blastomyces percursus]|uniref:Uncharacterized protein n=1 Tax=Blastomyces percursus TaxID=1658174 RepID=A0A1J9QXM6_9EURO|nr:hypothetical protein ACJ73_08073 [Blastomyces percursus]
MAESEFEVTERSKEICKMLLDEKQTIPEGTIFQDDRFRKLRISSVWLKASMNHGVPLFPSVDHVRSLIMRSGAAGLHSQKTS